MHKSFCFAALGVRMTNSTYSTNLWDTKPDSSTQSVVFSRGRYHVCLRRTCCFGGSFSILLKPQQDLVSGQGGQIGEASHVGELQ